MTKAKKVVFISLGITLSLLFIVIGIVCFKNSYLRILESLMDCLNSIKYYFCNLFSIDAICKISVIEPSSVYNPSGGNPDGIGISRGDFVGFWTRLFDKENFVNWWEHLFVCTANFLKILVIILPIVLLVLYIVCRVYKRCNTRHNIDTIPLKVFKGISRFTYQPIKRFTVDFVCFLKANRWLVCLWLFIWTMNLNLLTVVIEFIAYYLYFAISYDFVNIPFQFVKLWQDVGGFIKPMWWALFPLLFVVWDRWRKRKAMDRLEHMELMNCGFINELPIVSMSCGSMGKKKTTAITDMALSQEVIFRREAYERLYKQDLKFPHFPWISFEKDICKCMENGNVYNLASIKKWVREKRDEFEATHNSQLLYGYDYNRYGYTYEDKLKVESVWDVLETYAQLYFIYVIESSLIVSNYAIRVDNKQFSEGNFPLWDTDFFGDRRKDRDRHSHILDFDVLRLGKKMIENNRNSGSFEFGVVVITEVGKERGNNLELKEVKKSKDETNQKNDLFNSWLKMCRHSATVDNYPFIKVFTDEQRPESWGADARDLCDILTIVSSSETKLALPCYTIENNLCEWAFDKFKTMYYDMRFLRGDNTLLVHILKTIVAKLFAHNMRIYNQYGYSELKIEKERGTLDGKPEEKRYYLMNKKIYSSRFSTDCFSDYFNDMALRTSVGLKDYIEYASEKAIVDELKMQNSYFVNALYEQTKGGERNVS